jgi:hypothetical protein
LTIFTIVAHTFIFFLCPFLDEARTIYWGHEHRKLLQHVHKSV